MVYQVGKKVRPALLVEGQDPTSSTFEQIYLIHPIFDPSLYANLVQTAYSDRILVRPTHGQLHHADRNSAPTAKTRQNHKICQKSGQKMH